MIACGLTEQLGAIAERVRRIRVQQDLHVGAELEPARVRPWVGAHELFAGGGDILELGRQRVDEPVHRVDGACILCHFPFVFNI